MNDKTKPAPVPTFKVKVVKAGLTHDGKRIAVGQEIEVDAHQRTFLADPKRGFIADTAPAKKD